MHVQKSAALLRHASLVVSLLGLVMMGFVLIGWLMHIEGLVRPDPDRAAMVPTTAISLALLFCGLAVAAGGRQEARRVLVCAGGAALVALTNSVVVTLGAGGVDALLSVRPMHDRMSPGTITGLLIAAVGVAGLGLAPLRRAEAPLLAGVAGLTGILAVLMVHNFQPGTVMALSFFEGMSVYTALSLLAVFAGLLMLGMSSAPGPNYDTLSHD